MSETRMFEGRRYVRVSGGDPADASWEVGRIRSLGLEPRICEVEENEFKIYLLPEEAKTYWRFLDKEEKAYLRSPQGIDEQKSWGTEQRDWLRGPEGRFEKHQEKLYRKGKLGPLDLS